MSSKFKIFLGALVFLLIASVVANVYFFVSFNKKVVSIQEEAVNFCNEANGFSMGNVQGRGASRASSRLNDDIRRFEAADAEIAAETDPVKKEQMIKALEDSLPKE